MKANILLKLLLAATAIFSACNALHAPDHAAGNSDLGERRDSARSPTPALPLRPDNVANTPVPGRSPVPPNPDAVRAAIDVIHQYYAAINARDYRKAYKLWSGKGEASKQTFDVFRGGFSDTDSVTVDTSGEPGDIEGAAGSQFVTIPVRIKAKTRDGTEQNFWGEYVLRRSMADGASADQRVWRIYSARIEQR